MFACELSLGPKYRRPSTSEGEDYSVPSKDRWSALYEATNLGASRVEGLDDGGPEFIAIPPGGKVLCQAQELVCGNPYYIIMGGAELSVGLVELTPLVGSGSERPSFVLHNRRGEGVALPVGMRIGYAIACGGKVEKPDVLSARERELYRNYKNLHSRGALTPGQYRELDNFQTRESGAS